MTGDECIKPVSTDKKNNRDRTTSGNLTRLTRTTSNQLTVTGKLTVFDRACVSSV